MHCGCPLPGDTIGQKLSAKIRRSSKIPKEAYLLPPQNPDILQATHPSDHNAVYAFHHEGQNEKSRRERRAKALKRRQRDAQKVQKGKLDKGAYARGDGHEAAFLTPIPLYYGYGGIYAGCAAYYGGVNGGVGAGACAAGAGGGCAGKCSTLYVQVICLRWRQWAEALADLAVVVVEADVEEAEVVVAAVVAVVEEVEEEGAVGVEVEDKFHLFAV